MHKYYSKLTLIRKGKKISSEIWKFLIYNSHREYYLVQPFERNPKKKDSG